MIKAAIFDFDGTIANTLSAIRDGVNLTMQRYGFPTHECEDILRFINNGARKLIQRAMPESVRTDEELVSRALESYNEDYEKTYMHTTAAYDGVLEEIAELRDRFGLKIAVLSNKQDPFVKNLCKAILPNGSYEVALGVAQGMPTKPDARLTQIVLDELGVAPSECVLIGDSDIDLLTANNAGLWHIGVTWGFRSEEFLREKGATVFAHTPYELSEIIESINKGEQS